LKSQSCAFTMNVVEGEPWCSGLSYYYVAWWLQDQDVKFVSYKCKVSPPTIDSQWIQPFARARALYDQICL